MHGCDGLNKRGFARPYMLLGHILVRVERNPPVLNLVSQATPSSKE